MVRKNNDSFLITISLFISGFIVLYLYSRDSNDTNDSNDSKNDI